MTTMYKGTKLQFHLLPIRDWNTEFYLDIESFLADCNFTYSLLGIETLKKELIPRKEKLDCNFTYSLLGIETNINYLIVLYMELQFHLLPIRDWNSNDTPVFKVGAIADCNFTRDWNPVFVGISNPQPNCNFTYSLLGIETTLLVRLKMNWAILQFHLLPIRDWNKSINTPALARLQYCNFTYSLLGIETEISTASAR